MATMLSSACRGDRLATLTAPRDTIARTIQNCDSGSRADAVEMFEAYGRRCYGSQKREMEAFFARAASSGFAAKSIGITKPRQNGKTFAALGLGRFR